MSALPVLDPCGARTDCECGPAEFVRLRYFFGQRLGVVDLLDEQAYVVGKQRFHNARAHGAGVLCGLRAQRFVMAQGGAPLTTATTLLRVYKGAAIDACGREILVGWDQCIDVAAWFAQQPPTASGTAAPTTLRLWVALCYRECPSDPAPAPRDACGCDADGCEFARVREGFRLLLLTDAQAQAIAPKNGAAAERLDRALADESSGIDWARLAVRVGALDCPEPPADPCLLLARFDATLDAAGQRVVDIGVPDYLVEERLTLWPTALLQHALLRVMAAAGDGGLIASGPRWDGLAFAPGAGADDGTLSVALLADAAAPLARDPLAAPVQLFVTVWRFKDDGTWESAAPASLAWVAGPPARLDLAWTSGLVAGGRYRVLLQADAATPPVDLLMRPLAPPAWSRHFRLVLAGATLALAETLYP